MISFLRRLFIENWQRKLISLFLAMIIWMVINHSITGTKTVSNIPIRVVNLPKEKTIQGMQSNGFLSKKISLTLTGNRATLDEIAPTDLQVVIDGANQPDEWIAKISRENLICLNTELDIKKGISKLSAQKLALKQSKLVTEKVPLLITHPIGEPPKGYQFLDVWPYHLSVTVQGPEEEVKKIKSRGVKLAFNLNDISLSELETLQESEERTQVDEVSYFVPSSWKKVLIPSLSSTPFTIDDPQANNLRLDFARQDLLLIEAPIAVTVYYPPKFAHKLNPKTYELKPGPLLKIQNGVAVIKAPLYAYGVSRLFLETVEDMIQVVIIASPEQKPFVWNTNFLYPQELENRYVAKMLSLSIDDTRDLAPKMREDYLRNRFRCYMNRFRLYTPNHEKLKLKVDVQKNAISLLSDNYTSLP